MRRLPVIQPSPDPTDEPRFATLRERELQLMADVGDMTLDELRQGPLLSGNSKTSVSLDLPIGHTCQPTALCASVCYASRPGTPARWDKSVRMRLRTLRYFELSTPREAADRLWREFRRARHAYRSRTRLDFLRVNGTGDLTMSVVRVLNIFVAEHPEITVWVVSRKPAIAAGLTPRPNLYLQLSTDATTTAPSLAMMRYLMDFNPRAYLSFLRTKPDDDTSRAAIVFNEKGHHELPYTGIKDCPVDAGRLGLGNVRGKGGTACSRCRKCFTPKVLERRNGATRVTVVE